VTLNGESVSELTRRPDFMQLLNHVHVSEPSLLPAPASTQLLAQTLSELQGAGYKGAASIEMKQQAGGLKVIRDCLASLRSAAEAGGFE